MAVYGMWSGVPPSALSPVYTDSQAGVCGTVNTFAGIIGAVVLAAATDAPRLRVHLKACIAVLCGAAGVAFLLLALAVKPFRVPALAHALGYPGLIALFAIAGALRGACLCVCACALLWLCLRFHVCAGGTDPLFFELCAEVASPLGVPPGTAGAILTFGYHVLLCVMLSLPAPFLDHWTFVAMAALVALAGAMVAPVAVKYTRR